MLLLATVTYGGELIASGKFLRLLPFNTLLRVEPLFRGKVWDEINFRFGGRSHKLSDDEADRLLAMAERSLGRSPDCDAAVAACNWGAIYMSRKPKALEIVCKCLDLPCPGVRDRAAVSLTTSLFAPDHLSAATYAKITGDAAIRLSARSAALGSLREMPDLDESTLAILRSVAARGSTDELAADAALLLRDRSPP
jgi:hypothetical protein